GNVAGALETAQAIQHDNLRADVLQAVALAQAKAGDPAAAQKTLQEIRQIVDKLPKPSRRPAARASVRSVATRLQGGIAVAQARLGDFAGASQTASALDEEDEKARALLEIGTAQEVAGKPADAREVLLRAAHAAAR